MLFDHYTAQQVDAHITTVLGLLEAKTPPEAIAKQVKIKDFEELLSIAKARKGSKKTSHAYFMTEGDLRFATNEQVAKYRAKRLACDTLIEVGCGIGIQTLAFAETCRQVIGIDIDERKVRYAEENAKKFGFKNVEFIWGDALRVLEGITKADVVFVDPERAPEEEVRDIAKSFKPDIPSLIRVAATHNIAIELPPQIHEIPFDCEREYVSFEHQLNRLTAYLGKLKQHERSVIIIPGNDALHGKGKDTPLRKSGALNYLYEVDPAVVKAQLIGQLADENLFLYSNEKDTLLTSDTLRDSAFFKTKYEVIEAVENNFEKILAVLKWEKAGKVLLRAKIDPQAYWKERNKYEKHLTGDLQVTLFLLKDEALICRKL